MSEAAVEEKETLSLTDMPPVFLDNLEKVQLGFDPVSKKLLRIEGMIKGTDEKTVFSDLQNPKGLYTREVYYPSGRLSMRCTHKNSSDCGAFSFYHDLDGSPLQETGYYNPKLEKRTGLTIRYATDGKTEISRYHLSKSGEYVGNSYFITHENGTLEKSTYDREKRLDRCTLTAADGRILEDMTLNEDEKHIGTYIDTEEDGTRIETLFSDDGLEKEIGTRRRFSPEGKLLDEIPFNEKGNPDGPTIQTNGQGIVTKGIWQDGKSPDHLIFEKPDGTFLMDANFTEDGKYLTGRFIKGFLDGSTLEGTIDDEYDRFFMQIDEVKLHFIQQSVSNFHYDLKNMFIGEFIEKWPNGKTKSICTLEREGPHNHRKKIAGFYADYYEDGAIKRVGDTRSGEEYTYTSDGKPQTHTIGFGGQILDKVEWTPENTVKISVYDIYNRERLCEEFDQNEKLLKTTRYNKEHEPVSGNFNRFLHCIAFNTDDVCEKIKPVKPDEAMRLIQQTPDI